MGEEKSVGEGVSGRRRGAWGEFVYYKGSTERESSGLARCSGRQASLNLLRQGSEQRCREGRRIGKTSSSDGVGEL